MEISHRISINSVTKHSFFEKIKKMNISYESLDLPGGKSSLVFFDMYESDANWPEISELINVYKPTDIVDTFFSDEEIRSARWLRLVPSFEYGYPEPKSQWPIKQETHELLCSKCATKHQVNSFRIAKEPKLKNNSFMTLISCGEIFAVQEVFKQFHENSFSGYEAWDVLMHKTEMPSLTIKQIYVPRLAAPGLIEDENTQYVKCEKCSVKKYSSHMRGVMRIQKKSIPDQVDFVLSHEWFGTGFIAYREFLVSNHVGRLIMEKKWKGVRLKPIDLI